MSAKPVKYPSDLRQLKVDLADRTKIDIMIQKHQLIFILNDELAIFNRKIEVGQHALGDEQYSHHYGAYRIP